MKQTRRTVLGWILAAVIAPPSLRTAGAGLHVQDIEPLSDELLGSVKWTVEEIAAIFRVPIKLIQADGRPANPDHPFIEILARSENRLRDAIPEETVKRGIL